MNKPLAKQSASLCLLFFIACGTGAADRRYNAPYATLRGVITSSLPDAPTTLRVALVWTSGFVGGRAEAVAQDLGVRPEFPAKFTLDLNTLPPDSAMLTAGTSRSAVGFLVVFEDKNGNGKLDLLPFDAKEAIDRVLGTPQNLEIRYLEGQVPSGLLKLRPGFNLRLRSSGISDTVGFDEVVCLIPEGCDSELLPLDTEIEVSLRSDDSLAGLMCKSNPATLNQTTTDESSDDSPSDDSGKITCDVDGRGYHYDGCVEDSVCNQCRHYHVSLDDLPPTNMPSDWPCRVGQACTPGSDQTCNDDPSLSSLHGTCGNDGVCSCSPNSKNPRNGKCF